MKNWLKKYLPAICAGVMAFDFFIPISGISTFLWGEPEFPFED